MPLHRDKMWRATFSVACPFFLCISVVFQRECPAFSHYFHYIPSKYNMAEKVVDSQLELITM